MLGFYATTKRILDLWIAFRGFFNVALTFNLDLSAFAFSLLLFSKSYKVLLLINSNVAVKLLNIAILVVDIRVTNILVDYLDAKNFLLLTFLSNDFFNLILRNS